MSAIARKDGRKTTGFRQIYLKTGMITQAAGSAYMELEKTKIGDPFARYGPRETEKPGFSEKAKLRCEFKFASFSCANRQRDYVQDKEERDFSLLMTQALEVSVILDKFPKSVIDIHALVLESDGGALPAAITCASLALANAGIDMYDFVPCCSVAITEKKNVLLDPTQEEIDSSSSSSSTAQVMLAYMPSLNEVTQLLQTGELPVNVARQGIDLCIDGCCKLYELLRAAILPKDQKPKT